jgi:hypothetical protein
MIAVSLGNTIKALREKVDLATDELDAAIAVHEAWKVAAQNQPLGARIGTSRVAVAFLAVRDALKRDVLMALMRLWDSDTKAVSMRSVANILRDTRVVDALAKECENHWDIRHHGPLDEMSQEDRAILLAEESAYAREHSAALREHVVEAINIVVRYLEGGSHHPTFTKLKTLRDTRLAHRQRKLTAGADPSYREVESFYQDMLALVRLLRSIALHSDYDPDQTAKIHRRNAELFWAGISGEGGTPRSR